MKILLPIVALIALALGGCAHVNETYLPDGRKGHIIQCSYTQSMGDCYKAAANVCKDQGYQIIYQRNEVLGQGSYSSGSALGFGAANVYGNPSGGYGSASSKSQYNWFTNSGPVSERDLLIVCGAAKDKHGRVIPPEHMMRENNASSYAQPHPQASKEKRLNQKYEDFKNGR